MKGYEMFKVLEGHKEDISRQDSWNLREEETGVQWLSEKNEEEVGVQYIFKEVDEFYRQVVR
jgi:predicted SprT family Zn-dependent metalloprotease